MMKKTMLALGLLCTMASATLSAETYQYTPDPKEPSKVQVYKLDFNAGNVSAELCFESGKCSKGSSKVDALVKKLSDSVSEYDKLLSNKEKLIADAKKQASAKDAQIINDEANKKKFVMISSGDMNLAIDMDDVAKGDFSLVPSAMESNRDRYKATIDILKSGKAPAAIKTSEYGEIATVYQLVNVVLHVK